MKILRADVAVRSVFFMSEGTFVHAEISFSIRAHLTMERDKKNKDMASDRNNKCVWYCSNDRRLIFIASDYLVSVRNVVPTLTSSKRQGLSLNGRC
jgi:hypothetical protein